MSKWQGWNRNLFMQAQIPKKTKSGSTIWIIGGGKFGRLSARALRERWPDAELTVVEIDPEAGRSLEAESFHVVVADGIAWLHEHLTDPGHPDWIVPVVPVHLAFEWIRRHLEQHGRIVRPLAVPEAVAAGMVRAFAGADGTLYVSNADFICPDDCPEPAAVCTHTGKPRPCLMHAKLAGLKLPGFTVVAVRSRQLLPGMGGYRPEALFTALAAVKNACGPVLLASACCCHGVINAFEPAFGLPVKAAKRRLAIWEA